MDGSPTAVTIFHPTENRYSHRIGKTSTVVATHHQLTGVNTTDIPALPLSTIEELLY
ncbi:MAG: hypothetical protein KME30_14115 [Iphinoe sp. HA4291-MV1]|nr:hypothetical protein [Iphinoe sp. HA4291-MV1]